MYWSNPRRRVSSPQRSGAVLTASLLYGSASCFNIAVGTVSRDCAGMAAGVSGVCRQLGTAFGIAFLGAILTNQYNASLQTNISKLSVPNVPAAQSHSIVHGIITGLQSAGTFAGSTGLKHPTGQAASFAHNPLFPQIQTAVQHAFIDGTLTVLHIAAVIVALGFVASVFMIRCKDMLQSDSPEQHAAG